jgi:hypothetical protein
MRELLSNLQRRAMILRDTAQMRSQFPDWLLREMEQAADALEEAAKALEALKGGGDERN